MNPRALSVIVVEQMLSDDDKQYLLETIGGIVAGATTAIRQDVADLRQEFAEMKTDVREMKTDVAELKTDVRELKADVAELKADVAEVKTDLAHQRIDIDAIRSHVAALSRHGMQRDQAVDERFLKIEADIEELKKGRNPP